MEKIKSAKAGKKNPGVNKAAVKSFIISAFKDDPSMNSTTVSNASAMKDAKGKSKGGTNKPAPVDVVLTNVMLALILKQAKNQK